METLLLRCRLVQPQLEDDHEHLDSEANAVSGLHGPTSQSGATCPAALVLQVEATIQGEATILGEAIGQVEQAYNRVRAMPGRTPSTAKVASTTKLPLCWEQQANAWR